MSLEENFFSACGVGNLVEGRCRYVIFEMKQNFILPFFLYSYVTYTQHLKSLSFLRTKRTRETYPLTSQFYVIIFVSL